MKKVNGKFIVSFKNGDRKEFDSLRGADLAGANLYGADLYGADLAGANLYGADLGRADLAGANLRRADLRGADLGRADLAGADLVGADLGRADLAGADLAGANLAGANLRGADLEHCKGIMTMCGERYRLIYYRNGDGYRIKIGCKDFTLDSWLENFESIGKSSGFSSDEIQVYGDFIGLCSRIEIV